MSRLLAGFGAAVIVAALGVLVPVPAPASPDTCPPNCNRIPATAWIDPTAIPLFSTYRWPNLAAVSVTAMRPRFRFEEWCATPPVAGDPRDYAVAAKALVSNPPGQWQLQAQVLHWRGDTWRGGQEADAVLQAAAVALRSCQATAPGTSPSLTTQESGRLAAVISVAGPTQTVVHEYLVSHPQSSTVVELTMWANSPPAVPWPSAQDGLLLDALIAPLCVAYIDSCQ
ncbi:MAG TPA: ATPase [Mycobacterium sp.]|nr:ATPase [Mycobacterium sp.]